MGELGYRAWRKDALRQRDELEGQVVAADRLVRLPAAETPEAAWATADLTVKRAIIRALWQENTILPASSIPEFPQRWDKRRIRVVPAG